MGAKKSVIGATPGKGCHLSIIVPELSKCTDEKVNKGTVDAITDKCRGKTADQIKSVLLEEVKGLDELEKSDPQRVAALVADLVATVGVSDSKEINLLLQDAASKRALEILESQSKTSAGPCLSAIYDPLTGKIAYGQNFRTSATGSAQYYQWLENDADPLIIKLVSDYEAKIKNGEIILSEVADFRLAAHSEIVALDEILKNRRALGLPVDETTLSELYLQNIDLTKAYKTGEIVPKIRCEHCRYLTDGINVLGHN